MSSLESNSPLGAVGSIPRVVVEALIHRGELASLELKEAQTHGAVSAALGALAAGFLLLGGFAGTLALAASVWQHDDRVLILCLVTLADLGVAAALGLVAAKRLKTWQPFAETCGQFKADCACVHEILNSTAR
jgi:uncharacterized membrane protein YqjE